MPADLPMVQVDEWLAQATGKGPRQARQWRISGRVPAIVVKLLRLMAEAGK